MGCKRRVSRVSQRQRQLQHLEAGPLIIPVVSLEKRRHDAPEAKKLLYGKPHPTSWVVTALETAGTKKQRPEGPQEPSPGLSGPALAPAPAKPWVLVASKRSAA